jgi:hypothetical protein
MVFNAKKLANNGGDLTPRRWVERSNASKQNEAGLDDFGGRKLVFTGKWVGSMPTSSKSF